MKYLIVALVLSMISACGSSGSGSSGTDSVGADSSCPVGRLLETSMYGEIHIGNDNSFYHRNSSESFGYVTCHDNQAFTLVIESSSQTDASRALNGTLVQAVGTYNCSYAITGNSTVVIRCTGKTWEDGNFFQYGESYFLPGYY